MNYLNDFLSLVYPNICPICEKSLFKNEKVICMKCKHHLPRARFSQDPDNPAAQVFWGRIPLYRVTTGFLYNKGNMVQKLIHQFKYKKHKEIGLFLGEELGIEMARISDFQDISTVLPVPLHPKKQRKRGFNQSEILAIGLAGKLKADLNTNILHRNTFSQTQTRKSKFERWQNVEGIFTLDKQELIENKHILLVDDVITTGATIEACASSLLKVKGIKISVVAVAFTGW